MHIPRWHFLYVFLGLSAGSALVVLVTLYRSALWGALAFEHKVPHVTAQMLQKHANIIPVAIIGSGPAGLSAGLYAARGGVYTVVFEGREPGGQLMSTSFVENWPGLPREKGPEMIEGLRKQAQKFGAMTVHDTIVQADFSTWPYRLKTEDGDELSALTVIIATGAYARRLGIPGEDTYWGREGVSACAICDAPFYKDADVIVVGGGDSAAEEALQLAPYVKSIRVLVRGDAMRASKAMQDHLANIAHAQVIYRAIPKKIVGDQKHVTGIEVTIDGKPELLKVDGVFVAIGHDPNSKIFKDYVKLDALGYIKLANRTQETSMPGVYAAGDVSDHRYKQAGVASGDGVKAALDALERLRLQGFNDAVAKQLASKFYIPSSGADAVEIPHIESQAQLDELVLKQTGLVMLDFYTEGCTQCKHLEPVVRSVVANLKDTVKIVACDALKQADIAAQYEVVSAPTLLITKEGKVLERIMHVPTKRELFDALKKLGA